MTPAMPGRLLCFIGTFSFDGVDRSTAAIGELQAETTIANVKAFCPL
jgi:hypothetical protein